MLKYVMNILDVLQKFKLEKKMKEECFHCTIFAPTDDAFNELTHAQHQKIVRICLLYYFYFLGENGLTNALDFFFRMRRTFFFT